MEIGPNGAAPALGPYPSFLGVGLFDVVTNISRPDDAIQWAMRHGLLAGSRACRRCPGQVAMVPEDYAEGDGNRWRCPMQGCRSGKAAAAHCLSAVAAFTHSLSCHSATVSR